MSGSKMENPPMERLFVTFGFSTIDVSNKNDCKLDKILKFSEGIF